MEYLENGQQPSLRIAVTTDLAMLFIDLGDIVAELSLQAGGDIVAPGTNAAQVGQVGQDGNAETGLLFAFRCTKMLHDTVLNDADVVFEKCYPILVNELSITWSDMTRITVVLATYLF